jgi:hypothetical protein
MLFIREEGWKEIKLGYIYKDQDLVEISKRRCELQDSSYVAHLGISKDFLTKIKYAIESIKNKIVIADDATRLWNRVEDTYPKCEQILDFFHAKEHLREFARAYFKKRDIEING